MAEPRAGFRYQLSPTALPWLLVAISVLAVNVGFVIAVHERHVDPCWPYWQGCASISKVGRMGAAAHLYRFGMLPYATFLAAYWLLNRGWTRRLGLRHGADAMTACGLTSALALVIYLSVLGSHGELYQFMRRVGVLFYFIGSVSGHAVLARMLASTCREPGPLRRPWLLLCASGLALLAMGVLSVPAYWVMEEDDPLENALEWNGAALMQLQLLSVAELWRRTELRLSWHADAPAPGAPGARRRLSCRHRGRSGRERD